MLGRFTKGASAPLAILVFTAAFFLHSDNLGNALLGWDAYATIIASRIESLPDLWGTFSEVMMDGRFGVGDFYRPVGNLFIAFDYAVWGLDPFGYQLTNLVLWSLSAALVFLLTRRLLGEGALWGPVLAVTFYILHPAVLSVLAFAARRTETLQIIFILLTLITLPVVDSERSPRRYWLAGLFAALALASKETGIAALPLAFVHQYVMLGRGGITARFMSALRSVIPATVLVAVVLAARSAVIGGLGGYHMAAPTSLFERVVTFLPRYLETIAITGGPARSSAAGMVALLVLLALLAVAAWLFILSRGWNDEQRRRVVAIGAVGVAWLLIQAGLACLSFQFSARYVLGMVAGFSLVLAALIEGTRIAWISADMPARSRSYAAMLVLMFAGLPALAGSTLWYGYPGIADASRLQFQGLQTIETEMRNRPLQRATSIAVPRQVGIRDKVVDHAWMLSPWGLQAWFEMTFPDTPIRVAVNQNAQRSQSHWNLILVPEEPGER